jgi:hypothetical protein
MWVWKRTKLLVRVGDLTVIVLSPLDRCFVLEHADLALAGADWSLVRTY